MYMHTAFGIPSPPSFLGKGASFEDVADILGNSPAIVRKHYAKWSPARQTGIDELMERVHVSARWEIQKDTKSAQ
jgi:hypothetical protein